MNKLPKKTEFHRQTCSKVLQYYLTTLPCNREELKKYGHIYNIYQTNTCVIITTQIRLKKYASINNCLQRHCFKGFYRQLNSFFPFMVSV